MEYGIALASNVDAWKRVKRAEELGFTHAWFYDSQLLLPDIFVSMALAAEHTSKIKLGTGVIVPSNSIRPILRSRIGDAQPARARQDHLRRRYGIHGAQHDGPRARLFDKA